MSGELNLTVGDWEMVVVSYNGHTSKGAALSVFLISNTLDKVFEMHLAGGASGPDAGGGKRDVGFIPTIDVKNPFSIKELMGGEGTLIFYKSTFFVRGKSKRSDLLFEATFDLSDDVDILLKGHWILKSVLKK